MGSHDLDRPAAPPQIGISGGAPGVCPDCGHERTARSAPVLTWLCQRLGLRPPRARCSYEESSAESGVGLPGPCGCPAPFHGS